MALKVLMLRKKLDLKNKELEALRAKDAEFETRNAELEQAIAEAETDEAQGVVDEAIEAYNNERAEHDAKKVDLEAEIRELEGEIEAEEARQNTEPVKEPETEKSQKREDVKNMNIPETRMNALVEREDVQGFLAQVRTAIKEKRAISGVGYLIPTVVLGLLRENIERYSKLYSHVALRRVNGESRMIVQGLIPEAVWTEACANLNELDLSFSQVEVDGFKVGGYFAVCNASLEDSDVDLAAVLIEALGQAIGLALDKAILYGTGTKMPTGVMATIPAGNIVSHAASVTNAALISAIIGDAALTATNYSRGERTWVMNEATYTKLLQASLAVNAAGALVAGIDGRMPVIGGTIEVLNFVPDNVIIGGFFDLYLLAERAGTTINTSEHAFWVADQTGFKGTARYDGKAMVPAAFVAIGINGTTPATTITFAQDTANTEAGGEG